MEAVEQAMKTLIYPEARLNVEAAIEDLANTELQQRAWIEKRVLPTGECPSFKDAVNWLFDDINLEKGANKFIGFLLYDNEEAERVDKLINLLDNLLKKYGARLQDEVYIRSPEWPHIVDAAKVCIDLLRINDKANVST